MLQNLWYAHNNQKYSVSYFIINVLAKEPYG
jgi:hypothetical protein